VLRKGAMNSLQKEQKTIGIMIRMFCGAHHRAAGEGLCPECEELLTYAKERLTRCPFGENKGACSKCKIHCYKPEMRKRVTEVMRHSGPRMIRRHPLLAIDHLLKARGLRLMRAKRQNKQAR
jgi:hypothetical protein